MIGVITSWIKADFNTPLIPCRLHLQSNHKILNRFMMNITFAIPHLLWENDSFDALNTPHWNTLLRFAQITPNTLSASDVYAHLWQGSLQNLLKQKINLPQDTPAVLLSPIWQNLGMHSMNTLSGHAVCITQDEADALCADLSHFYQNESMQFYAVYPHLWLMTLPQIMDWQVPAVWDILGQVDGSVRADGKHATQWLSLQTEIQMFLHSHTINHQRQQHKLPTINGVWLWQDSEGKATSQHIIEQDNFWINQAHQAHRFDHWSNCLSYLQAHHIQDSLFFLDDLAAVHHAADKWAYQEIWEHWDKALFQDMIQSLQSGVVKHIHIISNGINITLHRPRPWAFWQTKKSWETLLKSWK